MSVFTVLPHPDDPARRPYGPAAPHSEFSALWDGVAFKCAICSRVTMDEYLSDACLCPECREVEGRGEPQ